MWSGHFWAPASWCSAICPAHQIAAAIGRYTTLANNYNELGVQLALGIPMALYLVLFSQGERRLWLVINASYPAFALCGIALTGSRTGILASLPGIVYLVATIGRLRSKAAILLAVGAAVCGMATLRIDFSPAIQRFSGIHTSAKTDRFTSRLDIWRVTAEVIKEHPLLGVGIGGLPPYVYRNIKMRLVAHNTFLSMWAEQGLIGLLLFVGLIAIGLRMALQATMGMRVCLLVLFSEWVIGASGLTWESVGATWLVLLLLVAGGAASASSMPSVSTGNWRGISAPECLPARVRD